MIAALTSYLKARVRGQIVAAEAPFSFLKKGDLVYDIGANIGNYSARFLKMGARVIALEPQPYCKHYLRFRFMFSGAIHVVGKGVSEHEGQTDLLMTNSHTIASVDKKWIQGVGESRRFDLGSTDWNKRINIELTTLDKLIEEFGLPHYIKIDVEGHEDKVIAGLHHAVKHLSFEYTLPEHTESCLKCVNHLATIGNYEFESIRFPGTWLNAAQMIKEIEEEASTGKLLNGDILARTK